MIKSNLATALPQEEKMNRYFDFGSGLIIVLTFVLFVAALFVKGDSL